MIAKCALPLAVLSLLPLARAADSPITLGDGSIVIVDGGGSLGRWRVVNRTTIEHPQQGNALAELEVRGPGAANATCAGRARCVVEIRWSTGQTIRLTSTAAGNRGARLEAQGIAFDDPGWQKSPAEWRFALPSGSTPTVTIRDGATGQPQTICQGRGCQTTVHYR